MFAITARVELRFLAAWRLIGWCLVATVVYFSLAPDPPGSFVADTDKAGHFLAYFTLMFWFLQIHRSSGWWRLAFSFVFLGVVLEAMQSLTAIRSPDPWDVVGNTLGVLVAWSLGLTPARQTLLRLESRLLSARSG